MNKYPLVHVQGSSEYSDIEYVERSGEKDLAALFQVSSLSLSLSRSLSLSLSLVNSRQVVHFQIFFEFELLMRMLNSIAHLWRCHSRAHLTDSCLRRRRRGIEIRSDRR
jgi:hypothetical protein